MRTPATATRLWWILPCLAPAGCVPNVGLPDGLDIACVDVGDCPDGYSCASATGRCVKDDANQTPTVSLGAVTRHLARVPVDFVVTDADGDRVSLSVEYTLDDPADPASTWRTATLHPDSDPIAGIQELGPEHPHTFVWDALADAVPVDQLGLHAPSVVVVAAGVEQPPIPVLAQTAVALRFTPDDGKDAGLTIRSVPFFVGNDPPLATVTGLPAAAAGVVTLEVTLADSASDISEMEVEFRQGPSDAWRRARLALGERGGLLTTPAGSRHLFAWDSAAPLQLDPALEQGIGSQRRGDVELRAWALDTPWDGDSYKGEPRAVPLGVDVVNQTPPRVTGLTSPRLRDAGGVGPVALHYHLIDAESDRVDVTVEVSFDFGVSWSPARELVRPESEGRLGLTTGPSDAGGGGGVQHTFVWDPAGAALVPPPSTRVRLRAVDGHNPEPAVYEAQLERPVGPQGSPFTLPTLLENADSTNAAVGDLNADGVEDLLLADDTMRAFLAETVGGVPTGRYVFSEYATGRGITPTLRARAADFDGDRRLDLWSTNGSAQSFYLLRNTTVGTTLSFALTEIALPDPDANPNPLKPYGAAWGHFDGDSTLDLVVGVGVVCTFPTCGEVQGFYMYPGDGAGGFGAPVVTPAARRLTPGAAADLDGDGLDEVIEIEGGALGAVRVFANVGGTFSEADLILDQQGQVDLADLDADGRRDLIVNVSDEATLYFYRGQDPGGGAPPFVFDHARQLGANPTALDLHDVNGDGILDITTAAERSGGNPISSLATEVEILFGNGANGAGDGTFGPLFTYEPGATSFAYVATLDLEADGVRELYLFRYDAGSINPVTRLQFRDGALLATATALSPSAVVTSHQARDAVADFDGDGTPDLVAVGLSLTLLLGSGTHGFGGGALGAQPVPNALPVGQVRAGDVNGDHAVDLVGLFLDNGPTSWGVATALTDGGGGTGAFADFVYTPLAQPASDLFLEDRDLDGVLDLVIVDSQAVTVWWGGADQGVATGTFTAGTPFTSGVAVSGGVVAADLDGDALSDLVWPAYDLNTLYVSSIFVARTAGSGDFAASTETPIVDGIYPVAIDNLVARDFNDDGRLDLAMSGQNTGNGIRRVGWVLGDGSGGFTGAPYWINAGSFNVRGLQVADLDGDGLLEAVAPNRDEDQARVYTQGGSGGVANGTLALAFSAEVGNGSDSLRLADLDGDRLPDFLLHRFQVLETRVLHTQLDRVAARNSRLLAPWGADPGAEAYAFGAEVVPAGTDLFGTPWEVGFVSQTHAAVTGRGVVGDPIAELRHDLAIGGRLRPLTLPTWVDGDVYLARDAAADPVFGVARLRVRQRFGPTVDPMVGAPNGAGLSLAGAPQDQRGVVVVLPVLPGRTAYNTASLRVFRKSFDWLRAEAVEPGAGAGSDALPLGRDATGRVHDVLVDTGAWEEILPGSIEGGSEPRYEHLDDAYGDRILVLTDRLGIFLATVGP